MKRACFILLTSLMFVNQASGQTEFKEPWTDRTKAMVIDPYWQNTINWSALATESRVVGIIHKASEGLMKDRLYEKRKQEGKKRGYLWGSYHLGRPGDPIRQADFYLSITKPAEDEIIALDLEDIKGRVMSLADALRFIERIKEKTGRYPLLYATEKVRQAIVNNYGSDSGYAKTSLWYVRLQPDINTSFPNKFWSSYTLWQFSSELNCIKKAQYPCPFSKPVSGTAFDMDINIFNGTVQELRSKWPFTFKESK